MPRFALSFLGSPLIERDGTVVEPVRRKTVALLAYLAVTGRRHGRETLADLLYPERDRAHSAADFRNLLSDIRSSLGAGCLGADREEVWLRGNAGVTVDVVEFRRLAEAGGAAAARGDGAGEVKLLGGAAALVRGEFLAGLVVRGSPGFEEWQRQEGESLRGEHLAVLDRQAHALERLGDPAAALQCWRRAVAVDGLSEPAHRSLMRLLAQSGDRPGALRQFHRCRELLRSELDADPEPETLALRDAIAAGRVGGAPQASVEARTTRRAHRATPAIAAPPSTVEVPTVIAVVAPSRADAAAAAATLGGQIFRTLGAAALVHCEDGAAGLRAAIGMVRAGRRVAVAVAAVSDAGESIDGSDLEEAGERALVLAGSAVPGQVLLSRRGATLLGSMLPHGATLQPLGAHRLKDLGPPREVFQIRHPDLPGELPKLRTLDSAPNNLPTVSTQLVGRLEQVATVAGCLRDEDVRLLTLTGCGGTGKTRLALRVAAELVDEFAAGVFLVDLASVGEPSGVLPAIVAGLGVPQVPGDCRPVDRVLAEYLAPRRLLLVLDNFEHLLPAASTVSRLLAGCPGLKVLATSRQPLHLQAEHVVEVPSLSLPRTGDGASATLASEAGRLFVQRATAVRADVLRDPTAAATVAAICLRLDGLPLALELAATRARTMPLEGLLAGLDHGLELLRDGPHDLPDRQKALEREIDVSHGLLGDRERRVFRRLAAFPGGCTREAAEAVCGDGTAADAGSVAGALAVLVDASLLKRRGEGEAARLDMLETIRAYAVARLAESGERESASERLAAWLVALAEEAEPHLYGPDQQPWMRRLDAERANFDAVLGWLRDRGGRLGGLRLAAALGWYWYRRARLVDGLHWLETWRGLGTSGDPPAPRAKIAQCLVWMVVLRDNDLEIPESVLKIAEESLGFWREAGDLRGTAHVLAWAGWLRATRLQPSRVVDEVVPVWTDEGCDAVRDSLAAARRAGDPWTLSLSLTMANRQRRGNADRASRRAALAEAVALARQVGDPFLLCHALTGTGRMLCDAADYDDAESFLREARRIAMEIDDRPSLFASAIVSGESFWLQGKIDEIETLYRPLIPLAAEVGSRTYLNTFVGGLFWVAECRGQMFRAARLWGACMGLGTPHPDWYPSWAAKAMDIDEATARAAWHWGNSLPLDRVVAYALSEEDSGTPPLQDPREAERRTRAFVAQFHASSRPFPEPEAPGG